VPPAADTDAVVKLAVESIKRIEEKEPACVLCQGEFTLSYHVIKMLKEKNIPVVCACSERNTTEEAMPDGSIKRLRYLTLYNSGNTDGKIKKGLSELYSVDID